MCARVWDPPVWSSHPSHPTPSTRIPRQRTPPERAFASGRGPLGRVRTPAASTPPRRSPAETLVVVAQLTAARLRVGDELAAGREPLGQRIVLASVVGGRLLDREAGAKPFAVPVDRALHDPREYRGALGRLCVSARLRAGSRSPAGTTYGNGSNRRRRQAASSSAGMAAARSPRAKG